MDTERSTHSGTDAESPCSPAGARRAHGEFAVKLPLADVVLEALDALDDGLAIFDRDHLLVGCNHRFHELHRPASSHWHAGIARNQIVVDAANHCIDFESASQRNTWIAQQMQLLPQPGVQKLADGAVIAHSNLLLASGVTVSIVRDITELQAAQESLRDSEQRYRGLFNNVPVGIWEDDLSSVKSRLQALSDDGVDDVGRWIHGNRRAISNWPPVEITANQAAVNMYRARNERDLLSATAAEFHSLGEWESYRDIITAFWRGETTWSAEGWEKTLDGDDIYVRDTAVLPDGVEGDWSTVIHTTTDMTAEKRAELLLAAEHRALRHIAVSESLEHSLGWLCDWLEELLAPCQCAVWVVSDSGHQLECAAAPNFDAGCLRALTPQLIESHATGCGLAVATGRPVNEPDVTQSAAWSSVRRVFADAGLRSYWSTPIGTSESNVFGAIAVATPTPGLPSQTVRDILDTAVGIARLAMERDRIEQARQNTLTALAASEARLREANDVVSRINEDLEERVAARTKELKETLGELEVSATRYAHGAKLAKLGHWIWDDIEDRLLDTSEEAANIYGFSRDEFLKHSTSRAADDSVVHPADLEHYENVVNSAFVQKTRYDVEFRAFKVTGEPVHIRESGEPIFDEHGEVRATIGVIQDVTDQRVNEQALRDSEERYRDLVAGSVQGILIHREHSVVFVNQAYVRMLGFSDASEVLALDSVDQLAAAHDIDRLRSYTSAHLNAGEAPDHYEYDAITKDGRHITVENAVRVINWDGKPAIQSTVIDVTERKLAEAQRLAHAQQQRDTLVREVHHRIKNNLQGVLGLLHEHGRRDPALSEALGNVGSQIGAVATVHGLQARSPTESVT